MPAKARKTAAKKAAPRKRTTTAKTKRPASFPLPDGHYLSTPAVARAAVSRGAAVVQVRRALGLRAGSVFDADVRNALIAFQEDRGLPVTGVVGPEDWDALHASPVTADAPLLVEPSAEEPQPARPTDEVV